ncbi:hypothetical protein PQG02_34630 (plasmid) [Nostoc sp. UHCC 0926]|nr:hypothetical protein PQG02_34630 [Nostoc sp. UHCC 0926]
MAQRKAQRLVLPYSQPGGWECIPRGSTSGQERGGGASRLLTSQGKGCILT